MKIVENQIEFPTESWEEGGSKGDHHIYHKVDTYEEDGYLYKTASSSRKKGLILMRFYLIYLYV